MVESCDRSTFLRDHVYVPLSQHSPEPRNLPRHKRLLNDEESDQGEDDDSMDNTDEKKKQETIDIGDSTESIDPSSSGLSSKHKFSDYTMKIISAIFYSACSFLISIINKVVLTTYSFPSSNLLGLGQMIAILIILQAAHELRTTIIRPIPWTNGKVWTLAILYLGNLISGLGGTKNLPLPMLIALRRFSIAMTAIGEFLILNVKQSFQIIVTIIAMISGSLLAAASDLTFNLIGYLHVFVNDVCTAANGVYTKKTIDSKEISKPEILYYNAALTVVPLMLICGITNDVQTLYDYPYWWNVGFIISFLASSVMGYLLMYSTVLCTHYNSALTTTIIGTIKNILTTYAGIYIGGDYRYDMLNFIGLNISLAGGLAYSYVVFAKKNQRASPTN